MESSIPVHQEVSAELVTDHVWSLQWLFTFDQRLRSVDSGASTKAKIRDERHIYHDYVSDHTCHGGDALWVLYKNMDGVSM